MAFRVSYSFSVSPSAIFTTITTAYAQMLRCQTRTRARTQGCWVVGGAGSVGSGGDQHTQTHTCMHIQPCCHRSIHDLTPCTHRSFMCGSFSCIFPGTGSMFQGPCRASCDLPAPSIITQHALLTKSVLQEAAHVVLCVTNHGELHNNTALIPIFILHILEKKKYFSCVFYFYSYFYSYFNFMLHFFFFTYYIFTSYTSFISYTLKAKCLKSNTTCAEIVIIQKVILTHHFLRVYISYISYLISAYFILF